MSNPAPSTFASELAAAKTERSEASAPAPTEAAVIPGTEDFALPEAQAEAPAEQAAASTEPTLANTNPDQTVQPKAKTKIKIGSQEFDDVEKAIEYAQELELAVLQTEAFNAGKTAATQAATPEKPLKTIEDEIADKLFDDPKAALLEYKEALKKEIRSDITKEANKAANIKQTWNDFYAENADLAGQEEIVSYIMQKNWNEVGHIDLKLGLAKVAEKTRAFLGSTKQQQLPTRELPTKPAVTPMGGSTATTTPAEKPGRALDFVAQLNTMRKKPDEGQEILTYLSNGR